MQIVVAKPPNWDALNAVFHVEQRRGVIFAFGELIYNPDNVRISQPLMRHEAVHGVRQRRVGVDAWWTRYIEEADYRLAEELPSHMAEYEQFCMDQSDRNARSRYLFECAGRLAGPLYGGLLTRSQAKRAILTGRLPT